MFDYSCFKKAFIYVLFISCIIFPLFFYSCSLRRDKEETEQPTNGEDEIIKPAIIWTNYDYDDGLGKQNTSTSSLSHNLAEYDSMQFQDLPITEGLEVWDIAVTKDDSGKTIWISSWAPVIYSKDGGDSWNVLEDSLRHSFSHTKEICVDESGGIWMVGPPSYSSDNGNTWQIINADEQGVNGIWPEKGVVSKGDTLWFVSGDEEIIRVSISTLNFQKTGSIIENINTIYPISESKVYIGTESGIYVSEDSGTTFNPFAAGYFDGTSVTGIIEVSGDIWLVSDAVLYHVSPAGDILWDSQTHPWGISGSMCKDSNNNIYGLVFGYPEEKIVKVPVLAPDSFELIELPGGRPPVLYIDEDDYLYAPSSGLVSIRHAEGTSWENKPFGFSTVQVITVKEGHAWTKLYGGVARLKKNTDQWRTYGESDGIPIDISGIYVSTPDNVLLYTEERIIYVTEDGGESFQSHEYDFLPEDYRIFSLRNNYEGDIFLLTFYLPSGNWDEKNFVLYRLDDVYGSTWALVSTLDFAQGLKGIDIMVDDLNDVLWVVSEYLLAKSYDWGHTWEVLDNYENNAEFDFYIDSSGIFYTVAPGGEGTVLNITEDIGASWQYKDLPITTHFADFFVDGDGYYWLGSDVGLYYSEDRGNNWFLYDSSDGLSSEYITSVFIEQQGGVKTVWLGTAIGAAKGLF